MTASRTSAATVILSDANSVELEDWGPAPEGTGAPMATHGKKLWVGNGQEVGLWKCAPGPSRWVFDGASEAITILSGRMTVAEDNGQTHEVKAGDTVVFPSGWSGTWEIHETIFKIYTLF